jgi:hypothetical protein
MRTLINCLYAGGLLLALGSCQGQYPEGMSRAERKKYYDDYNKAYTAQQLTAVPPASLPQTADTVTEQKEVLTSVPFSIRNNSLLPQKIEVDGNVLKFNPLEVRYVGFAAGTRAYFYDKAAVNERGEFLFEIGEKDRDKRLRLFD